MPQLVYKESRSMTPWGRSTVSCSLCRGVVSYSTPSHGGLGVAPGWAVKNLSPQAQALATRQYGKFWFEKDSQCAMLYYEHPELLQRAAPDHCKGKSHAQLRAAVEPTLRKSYPQYFQPVFVALCRASVPIPPTITEGCVVTLRGEDTEYVVFDTEMQNGYAAKRGDRLFYIPKGRIFDDCVAVRRPMRDGTYRIWRDPDVLWRKP